MWLLDSALGHNTGAGHRDFDNILFHHIFVVTWAPDLPQDHQRSKHRHRVVVRIFKLVDDAAITKTLGKGDLTREPVVVSVSPEGDNQTEQTSTIC